MVPYVDLKGHTLDFISLDGTVASQPWREGDQLMLRIRKGATGPTPIPR